MNKKVLFICTHNSARSQIAEALLNHRAGSKFEAFSAGTEPTEINPWVVKALAEQGFDISGQKSKHINDFLVKEFDLVVTLCDSAKEACPIISGVKQMIHKSFTDPSTFEGTSDKILDKVREVRNMINDWLENELIPQL
jgi:arsenate reductase